MNLREQILGLKPATQKVTVPQWNLDVYLQVMSALDRFSLLQYMEGKDAIMFSCAVLVRCLVDEAGNRLFSNSDEDIQTLATKEAEVIEQLTLLAMQQNKMTAEAKDEVKKN